MQFNDRPQLEVLCWLLNFAALAAMFGVRLRSLPERTGCLGQTGLLLIFLLIGALTSPYLYLILPLYLLTQVVVVFAARNRPCR